MADGFTIRKPGPQTKAFFNWLGNILGGLGVAMIVDMKLMDGVVTSHIPGPINLIAGLMIFGAVWLYVYKQLKKLN